MDVRRRGLALVLRFGAVQMACAGVVAVAAFLVAGAAAAQAALVGGLVVAIGNALFGWRLFAPGIAPVRTLARAAYVGEVLKWLWVVFALWLALGPAGLEPLPLLLGVVAAQVGFWLGVALVR